MSKKDLSKTTNSSNVGGEKLINDLIHFGYLLPTNDEELDQFENIYGVTQVLFPDHLNNPDFLLEKSSRLKLKVVAKEHPLEADAITNHAKEIKLPTAKNDFFKRLVLAAEIASNLCHEPTFGHIKFVKIQYLCEHIESMQINSNYGKYAAGPLDPKHMYSIDGQFRKRKWFTVTKSKYGFKYEPDVNLPSYKQYYLKYFSNQKEEIEYLINLFRDKKSNFCEIVATLYAVWKELLSKQSEISNESLTANFYAWDEKKKRFSNQALNVAIEWMNKHQIVPIK